MYPKYITLIIIKIKYYYYPDPVEGTGDVQSGRATVSRAPFWRWRCDAWCTAAGMAGEKENSEIRACHTIPRTAGPPLPISPNLALEKVVVHDTRKGDEDHDEVNKCAC